MSKSHDVYVPQGAIDDLISYLATRPDGLIRILIVGDDTPVRTVLSALTKDRELAIWVKDKIEGGLLVIEWTR